MDTHSVLLHYMFLFTSPHWLKEIGGSAAVYCFPQHLLMQDCFLLNQIIGPSWPVLSTTSSHSPGFQAKVFASTFELKKTLMIEPGLSASKAHRLPLSYCLSSQWLLPHY